MLGVQVVESIGLFWNYKLVTNMEDLKSHIAEGHELEIKFMNKNDIEDLYGIEDLHPKIEMKDE